MSQVGNAIKMLILLQSRGILKISELSELLEVSERTIRKYKDDLETCSIYVESKAGKYGGYYLENPNLLLGLDITNEEMTTLKILKEQLEQKQNTLVNDFTYIFDKLNVLHNQNNKNDINDSVFTSKIKQNNYFLKAESKRLVDIYAAIISKKKIQMDYMSLRSGKKTRVVHPLATYEYKNDLYFVGYCENRKTVLDFKLIRIDNYKILDEKFELDSEFDVKDYLKNCIGNYRDDEINIKIRVFYPMAQIIKEKVWVENQKITNEKDSIIFEAKMKGYTEILSWILSMKSNVKVLEPQKLINDIKKEIEKIKKFYT